MAGKNPKDRAPNWPSDPRVMELVVFKTVDVLKLPEVGGNPWQSRKLTECFRIVHEHLMASREKARAIYVYMYEISMSGIPCTFPPISQLHIYKYIRILYMYIMHMYLSL